MIHRVDRYIYSKFHFLHVQVHEYALKGSNSVIWIFAPYSILKELAPKELSHLKVDISVQGREQVTEVVSL